MEFCYSDYDIVGAGKYDKWVRKYRYIYNWIMSHSLPIGSVIEIGCNSGNQLRYFKEHGWRPFGLEFSGPCCDYAREVNGLEVSDRSLGRFVKENPERKFDLVLLLHTLEHIANPRGMLREVQKVLDPGGNLYVEVPRSAERQHAGL